MKYARIVLMCLFVGITYTTSADGLIPADLQNYIAYGAIVTMLLLIVVAMLVLLKAFNVITMVTLRSQGYTAAQIQAEMHPPKKIKKPKGEVWNKLLSLRPMAEEKELLIEHDYDGIQELDNPIPGWFMYLFYATIIFAVGYLLNYHVFHTGQLQYEEYKTEMAQADIAKKLYLSKAANQVDENTVKLVNDPTVIAAGQAIFMQNCKPCHGEHAEGNVGPNLTDDFWLHGGKINDLFKTIKYGVLAKGMPTWEKQLSPKQIADVANYVKSLHGTHPAGAKEPQGTKETVADEKLASTK
ncbi:cbb3-type cytochrome c oxidase N-terminal domain-containing protein [Mucilaginibacter sp. FT3.2]|uniref:cbb3-type cytochrome c oxidase N-terminal domain-containing protein n=1 Tax=Mucilaginibacter sp. FT3.2 TaxID=2723090 RepID=UPI00160D8D5C|nr:cbb3-type cytochrome c oxidase N-terminal domain-containing protein [Mucilaginibacter sp. FT3.2]MBB6232404.1 cytochrome c oxidase cbb3-type subunit 3 [Mucilaginibacter sp. FT3.2]